MKQIKKETSIVARTMEKKITSHVSHLVILIILCIHLVQVVVLWIAIGYTSLLLRGDSGVCVIVPTTSYMLRCMSAPGTSHDRVCTSARQPLSAYGQTQS